MKLLACDFDGTLYQNKTVTLENQASIKKWQAEGNLFVIATGRDYASLLNKLVPYDLKPDYIIGNNGATIDQQLLNKMDKKEARNVLDQIEEDDLEFNYVSVSLMDSTEKRVISESWYTQQSYSIPEKAEVLQLAIQAKSPESAEKLTKRYQQRFPNLVFLQNIQTVDIVAPATDKANALQSLSSQLDIVDENIYTIGDGLNDIQMLKQYQGASFPWVSSEVLAAANDKVTSVSEWLENDQFSLAKLSANKRKAAI